MLLRHSKNNAGEEAAKGLAAEKLIHYPDILGKIDLDNS